MMSKNQYLIDFYAGSHGHFLEYMVNCWVFNGVRTKDLFTHTGACHGAKKNKYYQQESVIRCGHFSQFDIEVSQLPEKVIRIIVEDFVGTCCYQLNVVYRAGDIPKKDKELASIPSHILHDRSMLRNDYFAKLSDEQCGISLPNQWKFQNVRSLEINMSSMYDFFLFLRTMRRIADFLEQKFSPDSELFYLWSEFMTRNQGWQSWILCNEILKDSIANRDRDIRLEAEQQALLNVLLSRTLGVFDGDLFDNPDYPTNTRKIYRLIKNHLDTFDARF